MKVNLEKIQYAKSIIEKNIDWLSNNDQFLNEFLYQSTQIKNIWIPYGE